jgi:hypothetical protein
MDDDNKVTRRAFLVENSAAVVGAAAAGLLGRQEAVQAQKPPARATAVTSAAGSAIPYSVEG